MGPISKSRSAAFVSTSVIGPPWSGRSSARANHLAAVDLPQGLLVGGGQLRRRVLELRLRVLDGGAAADVLHDRLDLVGERLVRVLHLLAAVVAETRLRVGDLAEVSADRLQVRGD